MSVIIELPTYLLEERLAERSVLLPSFSFLQFEAKKSNRCRYHLNLNLCPSTQQDTEDFHLAWLHWSMIREFLACTIQCYFRQKNALIHGRCPTNQSAGKTDMQLIICSYWFFTWTKSL